MAEGQNDPQGPFFYQEGGKTYTSLPLGMIKDIQKSPLFEKMQKDCKAERHQTPKNYNGKGPKNPCVNPTGIFMKCGSQDNGSDGQSRNAEGNCRKGDRE